MYKKKIVFNRRYKCSLSVTVSSNHYSIVSSMECFSLRGLLFTSLSTNYQQHILMLYQLSYLATMVLFSAEEIIIYCPGETLTVT